MTYYGYVGNILYVNLTTGAIEKKPLDMKMARDFLGGIGINNRLAYDIIEPGIDALSPDNSIILGAGPFAGTSIPGAGKVMATAKLPMSDAIATAVGGGSFGPMLKFAGYDHVVITGRADKPVYLRLDEKPEICDASHLWGKDIFVTTEELWKEYPTGSVLTIGVSGEKLVKFALAQVDNIGHLGRGGFGAVMGSKNLKAIVACPVQGVKVSDSVKVMELITNVYQRIKTDPLFDRWVKDGVRLGWASWCKVDFPTRNGREIYSGEKARKLFETERFHDVFKYKPLCCFGCPLADKGFYEIKKGEFSGLKTYASEYLQGMLAFGIFCNLGDDYNKILNCLDFGNKHGIDIMTASYLIAFATELYEQGIITKEDTQGLEPKLEYDTIMQMMDNMVTRTGFGDVLAEGWRGAIERIGGEAAKHTVVIKGVESSHYDIRQNFSPDAFNSVIDPRGPNGPNGEGPTVLPQRTSDKVWKHCDDMGVPEDTRERIFDTPLVFSTPIFAVYLQNWYQLLSSLDICVRQQIAMRYNINTLAEFYTAVTGIETTPAELHKAGERVLNMIKALNVREGFSRKDDVFPDRWLEPLKGEGREVPLMDYYRQKQLTRDDLEEMLDTYYTERGWDVRQGVPTKKKLVELGLGEIAEDLEKRGKI